jgi:uncharacterized coiled-coil protein SlyX
MMRKPFLKLVTAGIFLLSLAAADSSLQAKTRWSALHFVPDADFLMGGQFVVDAEGYYFSDTAAKAAINPAFLLNIGILEWVNIEGGYAGGPTLGFKARLLGESGDFVPSIAIGAHNIISNREAGLFSGRDTLTNEAYLAFGKSIEPLKMRIHLGLQTIPKSKNDQLNPYIALEEYFGAGLYASLEVFRREGEFNPSVFVTYRLLKKRLEIAAGAVRINRLFFDKNNQFKFALGDTGTSDFVKPGIWIGLRYCFSLGFGKKDAFSTVEDRVSRQDATIRSLSLSVDSLKLMITETKRRMNDVNTSLLKMTDSMSMDKTRMKPILLEKITTLKNLYSEEPFDPERVRRAINEIVALHENALPGLREILLDKTLDKHVRVLAVTLLGDIGNAGASDILLDMLSQTQDPDVKIEICIALGKIKETRAEYVLEQLANDPVDAVAFTAQEVLLKLAKETGMKLSPDAKMRTVVIPEPQPIIDLKIKTRQTAADTAVPAASATKKAAAAEKAAVQPPPPQQPKAKAAAPSAAADTAKPAAAVPELTKRNELSVAPKAPPAAAPVDTAKKTTGSSDVPKQAANQDVWDVGKTPDSAAAHNNAPKDSSQGSSKAVSAPSSQMAPSDSSHVAKLDSLLSATAKDKKADKKQDKKAKVKKESSAGTKPQEEPDNKGW